jgi:formylglycine-generating enzyme
MVAVLDENKKVVEIKDLKVDKKFYEEIFVEGNGKDIDDMFAQRFLVTQDLWQAVTGKNPASNKGNALPIESITWIDAVNFCNELSRYAGFTPAYNIPADGNYENVTFVEGADGYRMPTTEEMIYLAKGGNKSKGYKYSGSNNHDEVAWTASNSSGHTHQVGELLPNELGLYDLMGNVWNMCNDPESK